MADISLTFKDGCIKNTNWGTNLNKDTIWFYVDLVKPKRGDIIYFKEKFKVYFSSTREVCIRYHSDNYLKTFNTKYLDNNIFNREFINKQFKYYNATKPPKGFTCDSYPYEPLPLYYKAIYMPNEIARCAIKIKEVCYKKGSTKCDCEIIQRNYGCNSMCGGIIACFINK